MKHRKNRLALSLFLLATASLVLLFLPKVSHAAEPAKAGTPNTEATARWIDKITIAPVAAVRTANLDGESTFGAGADLGFGVNKFVSIHASAIAYEQDDWRGSTIDESEFYGKAKFIRFANETLVLYGKSGAARDWGEDLWGFGVGAGLELRFSPRVSGGIDYTVRAWFKDRDKDSLLRGLLNISF